MRVFLTTLVAILRSIPRSRAAVELENLALRRASEIRCKAPEINLGRPPLALAIVKPETVLAGHRAGFRLFWTW